ncbi:LysR family transcriptional regulator [Mediterraneibacter sp. NSJ-55]|uniref:LysR family transcriptional regulator n=1 Tax=Mediterraneibacter hominis TaxID=2763054 RepID=A0A923LHY0_9FIRM|nr:LysR family transcriptional regulator [Mediterraneibacter hominis]MBC5688991.1 LysR family transcriptional regulator [Mediterraneibacter hominis]
MDLTTIRYFTALARNLHFTKTAQELYISQQNLSQHIKKLEDSYNTPLFYRKPKLKLTPAGEVLYESCLKILAEEDNVTKRINDMLQNHIGSLSIGASQYRGQYWLPLILPDYLKDWPNIRVQITMEKSIKMEQLLMSGDLDFFVGIKKEEDALFRIIPLMNDKVFLTVTRELLEKYFGQDTERIIEESASGTTLERFKELPFIRLKSNYRLRKLVDQCFNEAGYKPKNILEAETIELMLSLFPYNLGAFFCTGMRVPSLKRDHPNACFFPVLLNNAFVMNPLGIVYHKDRFLPSYALDFIDRLKTFFYNFEESHMDL